MLWILSQEDASGTAQNERRQVAHPATKLAARNRLVAGNGPTPAVLADEIEWASTAQRATVGIPCRDDHPILRSAETSGAEQQRHRDAASRAPDEARLRRERLEQSLRRRCPISARDVCQGPALERRLL